MTSGFVLEGSFQTIVHDPDAVLDYTLDWSAWLDGDTIATAVFAVSPVGLTLASQSNTTTAATVWLSGGEANKVYTVTCHVVTAAGRADDRSFKVKVRER